MAQNRLRSFVTGEYVQRHNQQSHLKHTKLLMISQTVILITVHHPKFMYVVNGFMPFICRRSLVHS